MNADTFDILLVLTAEGASAIDRVSGVRGSGDPDAALAALKPRRGARVVVASDAVFAQAVRLPAVQTASLSPKELESALFYEVEPFCGIPRDNALVAFAHAGADEWNVAVVSKAQFDAIRAKVSAARLRLAGVVAPPAGAASADAGVIVESLFPESGAPAPVIVADRSGGIDGDGIVHLGVAATAVLAALCLCDFAWLHVSATRLRPRLDASEAAAAVNENIRRQTAADEGRIRELEAAKARREAAAADLAVARDRWHTLLSAFAETTGDDFAVVSVESSGGAASARCIAPSASAAGTAMARLSTALSGKGWILAPGKVEERPGGLAAFSFTLAQTAEGGR